MSFIISNNGLLMLSTVIMKFFSIAIIKKKTFWKNKLENKARDGNLSTTGQFLINKQIVMQLPFVTTAINGFRVL